MNNKIKYIGCHVYYDVHEGIDEGEKKSYWYVIIFNLYVHPSMRGKGIARKLMDVTIEEIQKKYPELPIKIVAQSYGDDGLNKDELFKFYSSYDIEVLT